MYVCCKWHRLSFKLRQTWKKARRCFPSPPTCNHLLQRFPSMQPFCIFLFLLQFPVVIVLYQLTLWSIYQFWNCGQQLCDLAPFNFAQQNFPLYFKRNRTIDRSSQDSHRKTLAGIWRRGITEDTAVPATTDQEAHCWHSTSPVETTERDNGVINKDYIRKPISVILSSKKLHSMLVL